MKTKLIYVTTSSHDEADRLAETVVTERLAACANIRDGVSSLFHKEELAHQKTRSGFCATGR